VGTGLAAIAPGGGKVGQDLVLWFPDDGETILTGVETNICGHVWGDEIKMAEVSISIDGGNIWTALRHAAPCQPGWNYCDWRPTMISNHTCVRVRGYDATSACVAGDGSQENLTVLAGPRPVTLHTMLLKTVTETNGYFSTPHGLERYTPNGYAIRAISVAAQHKNGNWPTLELSHNVDNRFWWNQDVVGGIIASSNFSSQPVQIVVFAEPVPG
jgi:hypothetical protein